MPSVLRRLFEFARPHGRILIPAFACMTLLGATTAAYAYLTGPALRFLLSGGSSGLGAVERFLPTSAFSRFREGLWLLPAAIVLRREIFTRLSGLSPTQLSRQMTGDLLSRFSLDVAAVETAAMYAVGSYARDGLQIIALVAVARSEE